MIFYTLTAYPPDKMGRATLNIYIDILSVNDIPSSSGMTGALHYLSLIEFQLGWPQTGFYGRVINGIQRENATNLRRMSD